MESVHLGDQSLSVKGVKKQRFSYVHSSPVKVTYKFEKGNEKALKFKQALIDNAKVVCRKRQKHTENVRELKTDCL